MLATNQQLKNEKERRRYFRIDDELVLTVRRLDHDRFDEELAAFEEKRKSAGFAGSTAPEEAKKSALMRSLEDKYPEVAEYLNFLEQRIDSLLNTQTSGPDQSLESTQTVNVSAQGIRFHSDQQFNTDDMVELEIKLLPHQKRLLVIGSVVWCLEDPNALGRNKYAVAIDFTYINEVDREELVKHIQTKQIGLNQEQPV